MKIMDLGQEIKSRIIAISEDCIFLDLNAKSEGIIPIEEMQDTDGNLKVKTGDTITAYFIGTKNGDMLFTTKLSGDRADSELLESAWKNRIPVEGRVEQEIKGGFQVKVGSGRGFCPYSQMGFREKKEPGEYIGKTMTFRIQEYKEDGKNLLLSNRVLLEEANQEHINELKEKLLPGTKVRAKVLTVHSYGAFVDIGNFKALLPVSEISRDKVQNIDNVLAPGDQFDVVILKTDWEHERVSVSRKMLLADPWENADKKYKVGKKFNGTVTHTAGFGVFIQLEPGLEGLVHISVLENADRNTNLSKIYHEGDRMTVEIMEIDVSKRRLSLKPATTEEQDNAAARYMHDQSDGNTYNPFAALLMKKK